MEAEKSFTTITHLPMSSFRDSPAKMAKKLHQMDSSVNITSFDNSTMGDLKKQRNLDKKPVIKN